MNRDRALGAWVGVDLDGTLAHYDSWDHGRIGAPIQPMVDRVKQWVASGIDVRIVTARVAGPEPERSLHIAAIGAWCAEHLGFVVPATCQKDYGMIELWDDRAVAVEANTGRPFNKSRHGLTGPEDQLEEAAELEQELVRTHARDLGLDQKKVAAECADVLLLLCGIASLAGIDLLAAARQKLELNKTRT